MSPVITTTSSVKDEPAKKDANPVVVESVPAPSPTSNIAPPPSFSQRALSQTLASTAHLANLLPTGTLLAFQLLVPIFSTNGKCDAMTGFLTELLLLALAASCFLASFTDSFNADGTVYHGFATFKGMWLFDYPPGKAIPDLSKYKIRRIDWIHGVLSVFVFAAVAFKDKNVISCLYPSPEKEVQEALDILPVGIGMICSLMFVVFPTERRGIGYPTTVN